MYSNWKHTTFDCFATPLLFIISLFCFPCQIIRQRLTIVREAYGYSDIAFSICCLPLVAFQNRYMIRQRYNIRGNMVGDCLLGCFCSCCSIVQQAREMNHHGDKPNSIFISKDNHYITIIDDDDVISIPPNTMSSPTFLSSPKSNESIFTNIKISTETTPISSPKSQSSYTDSSPFQDNLI
ncbi:hypothetical protein DLAC_03346 [Tieghemostelium lacteum]|uniref:PLAC8 family protein n=1 Tax=Tieghemostelium lacteum TaxID=361077 RepID=A0A152A1W5_TIELA|nr:hypothetical protein DLAC_03346 [Tieghemostelium lacteum]|eukprot:KYR00189.1 hypothetical protein DLAC_03346 [Tieghemostelium lacteum]